MPARRACRRGDDVRGGAVALADGETASSASGAGSPAQPRGEGEEAARRGRQGAWRKKFLRSDVSDSGFLEGECPSQPNVVRLLRLAWAVVRPIFGLPGGEHPGPRRLSDLAPAAAATAAAACDCDLPSSFLKSSLLFVLPDPPRIHCVQEREAEGRVRFAHAPRRVGARLLEEDALKKPMRSGIAACRASQDASTEPAERTARAAVPVTRYGDRTKSAVSWNRARRARRSRHGVVEAPARDAREPEVEDDEREARGQHRLARGECCLQPARTQPEGGGEVDARVGGALRVEAVAGIDERGCRSCPTVSRPRGRTGPPKTARSREAAAHRPAKPASSPRPAGRPAPGRAWAVSGCWSPLSRSARSAPVVSWR